MAYMDKELKQIIMKEVKSFLKDYNLKSTARVRHSSALIITIKSDSLFNENKKYLELKNKYFEFGITRNSDTIKEYDHDEYLAINEALFLNRQPFMPNSVNKKTRQFYEKLDTIIRETGNYSDSYDWDVDYTTYAFYYEVVVKPETVKSLEKFCT